MSPYLYINIGDQVVNIPTRWTANNSGNLNYIDTCLCKHLYVICQQNFRFPMYKVFQRDTIAAAFQLRLCASVDFCSYQLFQTTCFFFMVTRYIYIGRHFIAVMKYMYVCIFLYLSVCMLICIYGTYTYLRRVIFKKIIAL